MMKQMVQWPMVASKQGIGRAVRSLKTTAVTMAKVNPVKPPAAELKAFSRAWLMHRGPPNNLMHMINMSSGVIGKLGFVVGLCSDRLALVETNARREVDV